jgi:hypothetical protein
MLLRQKLQDAKTDRERQTAYMDMLRGGPAAAPAGAMPAGAMPAPVAGAPTAAPSQGQVNSMVANLTDQQRAILATMPMDQGMKFLLEQSVPKEDPAAIREYKFAQSQGFKGSLADWKTLSKSSVVVNMNEGQKGFENEMKLGSSFKGEPIYKEFNDMKSAFGQVVSSLSQGTPIGDVAGATKIMKLLDPGSVVRESELGIAMAAAGRLDRLQNYFSNMVSGQILTPAQREDFKRLSTELYAAAADGYNKKRGEYVGFGESYGFKNLDKVLGPMADVPSLMRASPASGAAGAAGGAARPPLSNIFGGR